MKPLTVRRRFFIHKNEKLITQEVNKVLIPSSGVYFDLFEWRGAALVFRQILKFFHFTDQGISL